MFQRKIRIGNIGTVIVTVALLFHLANRILLFLYKHKYSFHVWKLKNCAWFEPLRSRNQQMNPIVRVPYFLSVQFIFRVLLANQLKLESSSITGESEAQDYYPEEVMPNVSIFEAHNVALNGSLCVEGDGFAIGKIIWTYQLQLSWINNVRNG